MYTTVKMPAERPVEALGGVSEGKREGEGCIP